MAEALWAAYEPLVQEGHPATSVVWEERRQRIERAIVGLEAELPTCGRLAASGSAALKSDFSEAMREIRDSLRVRGKPGEEEWQRTAYP